MEEESELVIPLEEEEEEEKETKTTKKRVVWTEEEEEEGKGFSQLELFGDDFRPCSVSLAHFNFASIYEILYNNKKFVDYEVCDPLGVIGTHQLQAVLSTKNQNKSYRSKTKSLLDPSHVNFQPVNYLKSLHKHTTWDDLKRGRDLLQGESSKDLLERKQALINDYFEQFVTCHDTMQEVCGKLHNELSDATGNINGLVKSYEGMVAQAVMLKRRGREKEKEIMAAGSPMMRRKRSASVCSTPFEVPFSSSLVLSGSVAGLTEDFSAYLQSLASSSSSSTSTTSLLNNNNFYNNNTNNTNNYNNKFNPLSTSPTSLTSPPPLEDKSPSQSSLSSQSSIFPEILEEAGTDVIAHKLTDRVVGLVPKNQKKGGLVYHNVFRGKDVQKWVKSRITPFNDAATSVCQAMVQDGHLVKLRSSRRTSIPFIQDDHDFYALVPKTSTPGHSPHNSPPLSLPSSVASSPALSHRALNSSSAAVVDVAHSLGLPDIVVTPEASPISTPLPSPPSTPKLSSNHNHPSLMTSIQSNSNSSYPLPPTSTTKATQMKTAIASFCTQISLAIDSEILNADNPLPELEKAVKNIGNCFDTIHNVNSRDITSASQLKKGVALLSEVMEKVVRIYTEKAGERCIENISNGIYLNAQGEEITTVLNAHIRPTLSSIYRVINSATMHLFPPSTSPHALRTHSFSSLAYTWFFESFLIGCDLIHQNFTQCNGLSSQEDELEDAWLYEGEGWQRGSYRRWDEKGDATGWIELVVECDKLGAEFESMYPKFEKVYRPVSFEMQEKAAEVVNTIKALEGLISAKYMRYHSLKLREIAQCLYEDEENDTDLEIVANKFASMGAKQPISADVEIKQEELMRSYLHGVLHHMMVVHMETLSLSKSFRRQTVQDLLSPLLFQIRRSDPSRQASVEYAVLLRVINGKEDEDIRDSTVFDETTDVTENSNNSSPTQSDTASVHSHASSTHSKSLKETKPKSKSLFKKSKSKKKKSKSAEPETVWVPKKIPSSFSSQPPRSRKFTLSTHRLADLSNYRMISETPSTCTVDSHIKEDYEKAINLVAMVLECLDADCSA